MCWCWGRTCNPFTVKVGHGKSYLRERRESQTFLKMGEGSYMIPRCSSSHTGPHSAPSNLPKLPFKSTPHPITGLGASVLGQLLCVLWLLLALQVWGRCLVRDFHTPMGIRKIISFQFPFLLLVMRGGRDNLQSLYISQQKRLIVLFRNMSFYILKSVPSFSW